MISLHRIRAVLMLALVSAVAWGVVAIGIGLVAKLIAGGPIPWSGLGVPFLVFAFFGFIAGAVYAVAIGLIPRRTDDGELSANRAGLYGALGGALMWAGLHFIAFPYFSVQQPGSAWIPTVMFATMGGLTGLAIGAAAKHGALRPGDEAARALGR
jgi:hypothetical protein